LVNVKRREQNKTLPTAVHLAAGWGFVAAAAAVATAVATAAFVVAVDVASSEVIAGGKLAVAAVGTQLAAAVGTVGRHTVAAAVGKHLPDLAATAACKLPVAVDTAADTAAARKHKNLPAAYSIGRCHSSCRQFAACVQKDCQRTPKRC